MAGVAPKRNVFLGPPLTNNFTNGFHSVVAMHEFDNCVCNFMLFAHVLSHLPPGKSENNQDSDTD
jgi:hypothetical protein